MSLASSSASSSSAAAAAPAAASSAPAPPPPKGILKHKASRKRRSLVWNEANLDSNEVERIERGPRMKIDEPKTPYQQPQSHRSPEALQLDSANSGSEPLSPSSTNGAGAGAPPSDLNLGERIMDISNQALQRREHEWSDDDDDDEDLTGAKAPSSAAAAAAASSGSHAHSRHAPSAIETNMSSDGGASSGADTPEHKHAVFEAKKKANYSHMGDLLKSSRNKEAIAARLAAANKKLEEED